MIDKYKKIWDERNFFSPNINSWKPFKGWSKNERKHIVLIIVINKEDIIQRIETIQNKIAKYGSYIQFPQNYYHITIKPIGFLDDTKKEDDDYSKKELVQIIKNLEKVFLNKFTFEIELSKLNLFKDVVFIEINDNDKLALINKEILNIPKINSLKRDYPFFLPHCSIGTYKNIQIKPLIKEIENNRGFEFGKMLIDKIQLVIAHWHNTKYPTFEIIHEFKLK